MANEEIIHLIGKIRDRYNQIQDPTGTIVRIEVDLLRADIRELYEKISLLTQSQPPIISQQPQYSKPEMRKEESPLKVDTVSESEFTPGPASEVFPPPQHVEESFSPDPLLKRYAPETTSPSPKVPEPEPEIISPTLIPEPISQEETLIETATHAPAQTPLQPPPTEPSPWLHVHEVSTPVHSTLDLFGAATPTLADKFRGEKRSINEKLNMETTADRSIGSKLRLKITDLRSAIGINDRFIFINELFEGDMRNYDDMLGRLNTCASLQEALEVFNYTKTSQGWSDELISVERLLDFIHRRYA